MYSNLSLLWEQSKLEFPVFISCFVLFPVNLTLKTDFRGGKLLDDKTAFVQHESGIGNLFEYGSCRPSLTSNSDRKAINFSKIAFNCLSYHRLRKQGYFYKHPVYFQGQE